MIFPKNFETKTGFSEIRKALKGRCLSALGSEAVDAMIFLTDADKINTLLHQLEEMMRIIEEDEAFPDEYFIDMRSELMRIRLKGSHMEEGELFALKNSLETVAAMMRFLQDGTDETKENKETNMRYPALAKLAEGVECFPKITERIDTVLNKFGKIKDNASPQLQKIREALEMAKRNVASSLRSILHNAQEKGWAPQDAVPTLREGRLVIPLLSSQKRKVGGIVHDESATGKTIFLEPTEVVEANNRIRSLEAEEQREILRILQELTEEVRPYVPRLLESYTFMGQMDFIRAKALYALQTESFIPHVESQPLIDWQDAIHPLLQETLRRKGKQMVPVDVSLADGLRILLISGPNAGGKSITMSTVGLLQYMVQCGIAVPIGKGSRVGIFRSLLMDMGDEQSIEDELSTYSAHLYNMKTMMKQCGTDSLVLIDEMGSGTEPQAGAAIAQAMLHRFLQSGTWGIITTHYQNLKYFAQEHEGIVNGAMLYDKEQMSPLFRLQTGMPGGSFALEIARKAGLPQEVIAEAEQVVGSDYIQSDKYLQDIVRDKRYWENKRQNIHLKEKHLDELIGRYEKELTDLQGQRKQILSQAKEQATILLQESNAKIENTIRTIRETQAEKEETKKVRHALDDFKQDVSAQQETAHDYIARKIEQISQRRQRHEQRKQQQAIQQAGSNSTAASMPKEEISLKVGDFVRMEGQQSIGKIEKLKGKQAAVIFGNMRLTVQTNRLQAAHSPKQKEPSSHSFLSRSTREAITEKSLLFRPEMDVRGMNGEESLRAVTYFVEDAILLGISPLRILHGTGTGYLRQVIRQYLRTVPQVVSAHDEHVQLGGAGITVVELKY